MKKSLIDLMLGIVLCFGIVQEASALKGMELKTLCDSPNSSHINYPAFYSYKALCMVSKWAR